MDFKPQYSWEFLSSDEIEQKSTRALRNHIRHIKQASPWYNKILSGIEPEDIKTIDDFRNVPFTERNVLEENQEDFHGVSEDKIAETVITGSPGGKPLYVVLTATDLERIAYHEALSFDGMGINSSDRAQILISPNSQTDTIACYRGLRTLGVNTMRSGLLPVNMHKNALLLFYPTVLAGSPSVLAKLATELHKVNFDTRNSSVKKLICIGENLRAPDMTMNSAGKQLEEVWGAKAYSINFFPELSVSYCDCTSQNGNHSHPVLVFTEIVNEKGKIVSPGTIGELVATPLGVEGLPLLRYKTGMFTSEIPGTCQCGRNSVRLGPILGKNLQTFKLNGASFYPLDVTNALDQLEEVKDYIIIVENESSVTDRFFIHVAAPASCIEKIANRIRTAANVNFPILISNTATIQSLRKNTGTNTHILDCRQTNKK